MSTPQVLRLDQVRQATGLSKASLYRKMHAGSFPKPIKIGDRAVGWLAAEVTEWITARPRADI